MTGDRTVYVVDDDQAVLDSTAFLLDCFGFRCELFADPLRFLAACGALAPGCVVTDLHMPKMNGFGLYSELRGRAIGWPVLLMTSDNRPDVEAQAKALGFAGYLRKPVEAGALVAALEMGFVELDG